MKDIKNENINIKCLLSLKSENCSTGFYIGINNSKNKPLTLITDINNLKSKNVNPFSLGMSGEGKRTIID
jgi:hypothetical protein